MQMRSLSMQPVMSSASSIRSAMPMPAAFRARSAVPLARQARSVTVRAADESKGGLAKVGCRLLYARGSLQICSSELVRVGKRLESTIRTSTPDRYFCLPADRRQHWPADGRRPLRIQAIPGGCSNTPSPPSSNVLSTLHCRPPLIINSKLHCPPWYQTWSTPDVLSHTMAMLYKLQ